MNKVTVTGSYFLKGNYILIYYKKGIINTLNHELLHVASTYYSKEQNKAFSGYSQFEFKKIGLRK